MKFCGYEFYVYTWHVILVIVVRILKKLTIRNYAYGHIYICCVVLPVVCEGWHVAHMWKEFA